MDKKSSDRKILRNFVVFALAGCVVSAIIAYFVESNRRSDANHAVSRLDRAELHRVLGIYQDLRGDEHSRVLDTAEQERREIKDRMDRADAERRRLKGEIDVLKGMVSGLADPGVERD